MIDAIFIFLQKMVPQKFLSRLAGKVVQTRWSAKLIPRFIASYNVNMSEAIYSDTTIYENFHDFFTRKLKSGAREIDSSFMLSPCDGTIADIGRITEGTIIQAKKHEYSLAKLAASSELSEQFSNGFHLTIYLAPRDYHRVHIPCSARLKAWRYLPGKLFSVNATTARLVPELYARNERLVCHFESDNGQFLLIMVGAMLVSGIVSSWHGKHDLGIDSGWQKEDIEFSSIDELGQFCFGSTVILIAQDSFSGWLNKLAETQPIKLGQAIM